MQVKGHMHGVPCGDFAPQKLPHEGREVKDPKKTKKMPKAYAHLDIIKQTVIN